MIPEKLIAQAGSNSFAHVMSIYSQYKRSGILHLIFTH